METKVDIKYVKTKCGEFTLNESDNFDLSIDGKKKIEDITLDDVKDLKEGCEFILKYYDDKDNKEDK